MTKNGRLIDQVVRRPGSTISLAVTLSIKNQRFNEVKSSLKSEFFGRFSADPHITVLLTAIPEDWENLTNDLVNRIKDVIERTPPISITIDTKDLELSKEQMFIGVNVRNRKLNALHFELQKLINPLRKGAIRKKTQDLLIKGSLDIDALQANEILENGYERAGSLFNPHITLIYVEAEHRNEINFEVMKKRTLNLIGGQNLTLEISEAKIQIYKDVTGLEANDFLFTKYFSLLKN